MSGDTRVAGPITPGLLRLLLDVADTIPVFINVKDRARRYVFVNRQFADYYGGEPASFIGKVPEDLMPADAVAFVDDVDSRVLAGTGPSGLWDLAGTDADGHERHWLEGKWPIGNDGSGGATHVVTMAFDVTELHAARKTGTEREQQLLSLARNVPGAIARRITHPDGSASIPFIAGEFAARLGIDAAEIETDAFAAWQHVHADDRDELARRWQESIGSLKPFDNTSRFVASDGSILWYRSRSLHHVLDNGDIVSDTLTIDVTDEKLAQQKVLQERELLQSVTSHIPGLVFRRHNGRDGAIRYDFIEGGLLATFGVTAAEAAMDSAVVWRHFLPEDRAEAQRSIAASLDHLQPYSYTARCRLPSSGEVLWIEVSATPRALPDGTVVTDGIAVDVSSRMRAEEELRAQRSLLQQVIDAVPAAINVKDRDGHMELANRTLADYYGVEPHQLLWTADAPIIDPPAEEEQTRLWDLAVLETGEVSEAREHSYIDRSGQIRHWLGKKSPLRNAVTGAVERVVTVSLDITDRVVAESRAREAELRLGSIVENLPGMILRRRHLPDGRIDYIYAAGRIAADLGISSDPAHNDAEWSRMFPEDRERLVNALGAMARSMVPLVSIERYRMPDGAVRWIQNFSQPRRLDDGTVVSDAILLDVTERLSAEDHARQRDALLRSVAASIPGAILRWRVDPQGQVEQEFAAGQLVETGQIASAAGQRAMSRLWPTLHPDDARLLGRELSSAAARRGTVELELRSRQADETRWIKLFGRFRARVENETAWDLILLDATESKRYEEQLRIAQKMDAIGNLTGGVAHDFNNVLAIIVANLDLLLDGNPLDAEDRQIAEAALHAAERGADLTAQLLAFARRQPAEPQTFDCNARIEGFASLMQRSLGPQVRLEFRLAEHLPHVRVDPAQFESALMNLVVNARDALDGRGEIVIETRESVMDDDDPRPPSLEPGRYVVISVTDFGSGMTPEVQRRAFEPLFTTKSEGRGTGFGLPMVYNFARQAGGQVTLYSEPGFGTTLRIYLPARDRSADVPAAAAAPGGAPVTAQGRILLVDDNGAARAALASQLRRTGYEVAEASGADEALQAFGDGAGWDLLITDVVMPGKLNGVELADRLRERNPGLPVLLMSGYPSDALSERNLQLRRYDLIGKPFRRHDLLATVARLVGAG